MLDIQIEIEINIRVHILCTCNFVDLCLTYIYVGFTYVSYALLILQKLHTNTFIMEKIRIMLQVQQEPLILQIHIGHRIVFIHIRDRNNRFKYLSYLYFCRFMLDIVLSSSISEIEIIRYKYIMYLYIHRFMLDIVLSSSIC